MHAAVELGPVRTARRQAVLWDLDGTLVDTSRDIAAAIQRVRAGDGLPALPLAEVLGMVGDGMELLLSRALAPIPVEERHRDAFIRAYGDGCDRDSPPYDGIITALSRIHAMGWAQGVVTNKPGLFTDRIIQAAGIARFLPVVVAGDGVRKPDPAPVLAALRRLGIPAEHAWMVGDHRTDLAAGAAAGCRTVFCTWGFGRRDGLPADAIAGEPLEVLRAIGVACP